MRYAGAVLAWLLGVLAAPAVMAADVTLSWAAATKCSDGSPLTPGGYNVYRSTSAAITTKANGGAAPIAGGSGNVVTALTWTDKAVPPGTYYYAVSTWGNCGAGILEGNLSGVLSVIVPVPPAGTPSAPVSLSATCSTGANSKCTVTVVSSP